MKKIHFALSALLFCLFSVSSCEYLDDFQKEDADKEGIADDGTGEGANDYLIMVPMEGVLEANMLIYCVNMTHQYKYDVAGLEDCSWARVRHVQNQDGNDWTPLLTVDPNDTGEVRSVRISISCPEISFSCDHEITQACEPEE